MVHGYCPSSQQPDKTRIEFSDDHTISDKAHGDGLQLLQYLLVHVSVSYNASPQHHSIRVGHAHEVHDKVGQCLGSYVYQCHAKGISLLSKCKHFTHSIVETYACGNSLHAIHASARTLHTYLYAYPEMAYLTGIEMTAPYLAPVYHRTNSYTCTHIEIDEVLRYLPEPPKTFGTGGTLYIIVYMTRYTVNFFKFLGQGDGVRPAGVNL